MSAGCWDPCCLPHQGSATSSTAASPPAAAAAAQPAVRAWVQPSSQQPRSLHAQAAAKGPFEDMQDPSKTRDTYSHAPEGREVGSPHVFQL